METKILSLIAFDRKAYNEIKDTLQPEDFSDFGEVVLKQIIDYYAQDPSAQEVDTDILKARLERAYPHHTESLRIVVDNLTPVSVPNVLSEYVDLRIHSLAQRIGGLLSAGTINHEASELIEEFNFLREKREAALAEEGDSDEIYINPSVTDIVDEVKPENLIHLYPKSLNEALEGGVVRGTHIVMFARPETGKSMFSINLTGSLLQQGLRVLYLGNEDPAKSMLQRLVSNLTGMDRHDLLADPEEADERAKDAGLENLVFVSKSPGSVADVRRLVAKHKPDVFIVDQIRNLNTSVSLTKVESLEYIAQSMRNIAKEHQCVGISITQAGDSADNVLVLGMGDVDFSNTGIPSTADLMIGIGVNPDWERMDRRMLSLCKNKISGNHASIPVAVNPKLSRIYDVE